MQRRRFLGTGLWAAGGALLAPRLSFANTSPDSRPRLVFVIMRGALDGLATVPPYADPQYAAARRELAIAAPGDAGGALPLDGFFGLHPSLVFLRDAYVARELIVFHATASPYRERSHFDGQDVLENGCVHPHAIQTGWLNRALVSLQSPATQMGVALGQNIPLVLRGTAAVTSWSPAKLASLDADTLDRIMDMYAGDPLLAARLADGLAGQAIAAAPQPALTMPAPDLHDSAAGQTLLQRAKSTHYTEVIRAAAGFLRRDGGPQVAVFDTTGWDTHANEGNAAGQLAARLAALDAGLRLMKDELGPVWRDTAVVLATEFGRTVAVNGTRGTDHGTATAAFLLGGAVQGGRVLADWPGLKSGSLYEGRDLAPTTDLRSVLKGVLGEHLQVGTHSLETAVFPESGGARPIKGLIRA